MKISQSVFDIWQESASADDIGAMLAVEQCTLIHKADFTHRGSNQGNPPVMELCILWKTAAVKYFS
jgi:hypothetical protein